MAEGDGIIDIMRTLKNNIEILEINIDNLGLQLAKKKAQLKKQTNDMASLRRGLTALKVNIPVDLGDT